MNISCKVIEDILPLYVDECCSEDTKQLVEEHLMKCEDCKERLKELRQPIFLSQGSAKSERAYAKHVKRTFKKLRRRWVVLTFTVLILLLPLMWLGMNEVRGEGVSYSSLPYIFRGNALLGALKNENYEKAFQYLNLKALYAWETEIEESDINSEYSPVKIGGDIFYVDREIYKNEYQYYLVDKDETVFWRSVYLNKGYMLPERCLKDLEDLEDIEQYDFMEYMVDGRKYYIEGEYYNYDVENVGNSVFKIMPEQYYNQVKQQINKEEKETKQIIQRFLDMGYDGYVEAYQQEWTKSFEQLKEDAIIIEGYKLSAVYHTDSGYQLDYQLILKTGEEMNSNYGVTFAVKKDGFYPIGGSFRGSSTEYDRIPIVNAFSFTLGKE